MLARCLLLAASVLLAVPASAQTTFTVTTAASGGPGSLRQAIQSANAEPNGAAPDTIAFDLSGTGPFTIRPTSELPVITEAVVIDGLSQPGADCSTWPATLLIEMDGSLAGSESDGLLFENGGGSTVRGMVINRFGSDGVDVEGDGGNTFVCNYVGTDPTGTIARPNGDDGFDIDSSDNVVGGPTPSDRNLISGNGNPGSVVGDGIDIGGDPAQQVNGDRNVVQGNYIGVAADGMTPLGNGDDGVEVQDDARDNVIGGTAATEGNVIGFNGDNGVQVEDAGTIRNAILGNAIFGNRGRGIELQVSSGGEQTPNDPDDRDSGPNGFQNYPVLTSARTADNTGATTIEGTLDSTPGTTFRVELFANETLDADGFGPGAVFVGAVDVTTDASGDGAFTIDLTEPLAAGLFVTSTATDADGNTSEFGEGIEVEALMNTTAERAPGPLAMTVAPNPASNVARIVLDGTGEADVLVVDVQGRVVLAETVRQPAEVAVPLAGLAPGVYAVRVSSGGDVRSARLTVVR